MKCVRVVLCAVLLALEAFPAFAWTHGSAVSVVGLTNVNFDSPSGGPYFTNLAHTLVNGGSSQTNFISALTSDGFPTSSLTSSLGSNTLKLVPNYFGHYKTWWLNSGAFTMSGVPLIVYGGGASVIGVTPSNSGSVSNNPGFGYDGAGQPTCPSCSGNGPVEWAIGALANAVADGGTCTGGTAGLVCLTSSVSGAFGNWNTGQTIQVHNVTNLSATTTWTLTKLDSSHIQLQGSTYSGSMAIQTGSPGTQSEAIASNINSLAWSFPAQGSFSTSYPASTCNPATTCFGGMVICRSQNQTAPNDDCDAIVNNSYQVNIDYITNFKSINPRWLRTMDITAVQNSNQTNFSQRPLLTNLGWGGYQYQTSYYAGMAANGGISGSCSDLYTISNPSGSPSSGAYVEGETVIFQIGSTATNTGYTPCLQVSGRSGAVAAPIYNNALNLLGMLIGGSISASCNTTPFCTEQLTFTGGGLASPHTITYTTVAGDTSISTLLAHIETAVNNDATLAAAGGGISAQNENWSGSTSNSFSLFFNPNINSSGAAALGNGMTVTGTDSAGTLTYTFGTVLPGFMPNSEYTSCIWEVVLQGWRCEPAGGTTFGGLLSNGPPIEVLEELANRSKIGLWYNIPIFYTQASITALVTHLANSGVQEAVLEFSNESWNNALAEWRPVCNMSRLVGFPQSAACDSFHGLRTALLSDTARAAWIAAGRNINQLFITDAYQFVAYPNGGNGLTLSQRFNGGAITPGSNVVLAAYGNYGGISLSTNYSVFPNRPVDKSDLVSPAPYFCAFSLSNGCYNMNSSISTYNCLLVAAYNYVNGNSTNQAASLAWLYSGGLSGTGDAYDTGSQVSWLLGGYAHGSGISGAQDYFGIGGASGASSYDSVRTGTNPVTGQPWRVLGVAAYEGDWQVVATTSGDISTINSALSGDSNGYTSGLSGLSCHGQFTGPVAGPSSTVGTGAGSDASNIVALHLAFKNSTNFRDLYLRYFNDFVTSINSQGTRIAVPGTYGFEGTGGETATNNTDEWSKYPGSMYNTPPAFGSYQALQQFH